MAKLSFTTMGTPELSGQQAIQLARKLGYDGVDLRVSDFKGELTRSSTDQEILDLKKVFADEGVESSGLLCYGNRKISMTDDSFWKVYEETLLRETEIGAKLGSASIRMFGGDITAYGNEEEYIQKISKCIAKSLDAFPTIKMILQNHCNSFTFLQGVRLAENLGHERFGLAFSPDHCFLMQEDIREAFSQAKRYSFQMYISDLVLDASEVNERHYIKGTPILPGKGHVDIQKALEAIGGADFNGWITFKWEKIWHEELEEPEIALPYFLKYIRGIL